MKKNIVMIVVAIAIYGYSESILCMFSRARQAATAMRRRGYATPTGRNIQPLLSSSLSQAKYPQTKTVSSFGWINKIQANLSSFPKFSSGSHVVELLNEGRFPSLLDIKNIVNETGFFRSFFLKTTLNRVDANNETLLGKAIGLIIQDIANLDDEKIEVIKKLYALGARLSPQEQDAFQKHFPATLQRIIDTYSASYRNIKISTLHRFARLLGVMSHIGVISKKSSNGDIDIRKVALLAYMPTFSPAVANKSINQINALSDAEKELLLYEDIKNFKELGLDEALCNPDSLVDMLFFIKTLGDDHGFLKSFLKLPATASAAETKAAFVSRHQEIILHGTEEQKEVYNSILKNLDQDIEKEKAYKRQRLARE